MRIAILPSVLVLFSACQGMPGGGAQPGAADEPPMPVTTVVASSLNQAPPAPAQATAPAVMNNVPAPPNDAHPGMAPDDSPATMEKTQLAHHRVHPHRSVPKHRNVHAHEVFRSASSPE